MWWLLCSCLALFHLAVEPFVAYSTDCRVCLRHRMFIRHVAALTCLTSMKRNFGAQIALHSLALCSSSPAVARLLLVL